MPPIAERERQHRNRGKAGTTHELPQRVADVLNERFHELSPGMVRQTRCAAAGEFEDRGPERAPSLPRCAREQVDEQESPQAAACRRSRGYLRIGAFGVEVVEQLSSVARAERTRIQNEQRAIDGSHASALAQFRIGPRAIDQRAELLHFFPQGRPAAVGQRVVAALRLLAVGRILAAASGSPR